MTARVRTVRGRYRCAECGHQAAQWVGRCPACRAWGSLERATAAAVPARARVAADVPIAPARRIADVALDSVRARPTGVSELDRVLGGGLIPGSVVLLAGEPGVGKSTLLLEVSAKAADAGRVLYVTGEESAGQVRLRAERIGAVRDELYLAAESDLGAIVGHLDALDPELLVVDSIQTMITTEADGAPGGVTRPAPSPSDSPGSPGAAGCRWCWSDTSRRTARSLGRGCWSTSWTSCCRSRVTSTRRCAWCAG